MLARMGPCYGQPNALSLPLWVKGQERHIIGLLLSTQGVAHESHVYSGSHRLTGSEMSPVLPAFLWWRLVYKDWRCHKCGPRSPLYKNSGGRQSKEMGFTRVLSLQAPMPFTGNALCCVMFRNINV